jgi:hypothetical protein
MQRRGTHRAYERIIKRTSALVFALVLALLSFSCAGGSGSSGFDLAENEAINMALDEQRCVESEGLTICPAAMPTQPNGNATATPSETPVPIVPTTTPTMAGTDFPTRTPSVTPGQLTATVAPSPTPTPTATPTPTSTPPMVEGMSVTTSFDGAQGPTCFPTNTPGTCILVFTFSPQGFQATTQYQVAVRSAEDDPWELRDAVELSFDATGSLFGSDIPINTLVQGPTAGVFIQTAVLVFIDQPPFLRASEIIESLAESGADFAYVSPLEDVAVIQ